MGLGSLLNMLEAVDTTDTTVVQVLSWHLSQNHCPSLPAEFMEPARQSIIAVACGDRERTIALPEGCTHQGMNAAPASMCVDEWHLHPFVDYAKHLTTPSVQAA